ncbi:putative porin [Microbulbifer sp. SSSA002]|uniref:putative porin n=1 Tax=Microbulbifer sp. SSSA002 TaxID=3243376 RepID=UPI0040396B79
MRFKLAALPLMLVAATAGAEEYNSFTNATYSDFEAGSVDADQIDLDTTYYFGPKETLGPLKEFEYINKVSNVFAGYSYVDIDGSDDDVFGVGGEYFASNGVVLGAAVYDLGGENLDALSIGYLFTPNFLVTLEHVDNDSDNEFSLEANYNHQLNATDYLGFTFNVDEEFDTRSLSSKYFTHLGGEQYLTAELAYVNYDEGDDYWKLGTEYFFTKRTSVGFSFDEVEQYELGMTHFFNTNVAAKAAYVSNTDNDMDYDIFQFGLTVQL